jgi:hypothetical protein
MEEEKKDSNLQEKQDAYLNNLISGSGDEDALMEEYLEEVFERAYDIDEHERINDPNRRSEKIKVENPEVIDKELIELLSGRTSTDKGGIQFNPGMIEVNDPVILNETLLELPLGKGTIGNEIRWRLNPDGSREGQYKLGLISESKNGINVHYGVNQVENADNLIAAKEKIDLYTEQKLSENQESLFESVGKYTDSIGENDEIDGLRPVEFTFNYDDGTSKTLIVKGDSKFEEIERKLSLDEIKTELEKNAGKINSVEIKNGDKFHKKIQLKDFINKELNTVNHSSNPEKLGEDIIISILKPLKIYNNYIGQIRQEREKKALKSDKPQFTISVNQKEYQFERYTEDFKKIVISDPKSGEVYEIKNDKNFKFIVSPGKEINNIEMDLLHKGKQLLHKEKTPFKINLNSESGKMEYLTISEKEFTQNILSKVPGERENKKNNSLSL